MSKKLYVGNLSFEIDNKALEQLFATYGKVESVNVINDRNTGQSRGFGFVEMSSKEEAKAAIAALDGKEHGGRALRVSKAKQRENRSGPRGRDWGGYGHHGRDDRGRGYGVVGGYSSSGRRSGRGGSYGGGRGHSDRGG